MSAVIEPTATVFPAAHLEPSTAAAPAARELLVLLGHPRGTDSLCGALANAYVRGARAAGWRARLVDVSRLEFDTDVRLPSPRAQALEPDLEQVRDGFSSARHIVFVYPNWWGTMPALLKGLLDRVLVPGWAFRECSGGTGFEGLLGGRSAEILTTMDTPDFVYRWLYHAPGQRAMADATLGFCGIDVLRTTRFGMVKSSTPAERERWLEDARSLGAGLGEDPLRDAPGGLARRMTPWVRALRLQFYPMSFIAYWVGALLAAPAGGIEPWRFLFGYLVLFLIEAATVFINDIHDHESDRRNAWWGPFSGGSRVLLDGRLEVEQLARGAWYALGGAFIACLVLVAMAPVATGLAILAAALVLGVLAVGYTLPPLALSHRGLGEIDVALTNGLGVLVFGFIAHGGSPGSTLPWLVGLPMGLAILPAILLAGVPDHDADAASGKRILVVAIGIRRSIQLAAASVVAAVVLAAVLHQAAGITALAGVAAFAGLHAVGLVPALLREAERGPAARRIDGLIVVALSFILWFGIVPLANLLRA
ncbi:MAG: NAD(P)H-dependent oxidoreductase [Burkholderiaceae bacterium]